MEKHIKKYKNITYYLYPIYHLLDYYYICVCLVILAFSYFSVNENKSSTLGGKLNVSVFECTAYGESVNLDGSICHFSELVRNVISYCSQNSEAQSLK